jgi:hypothetical protein
MCVGERNPTRPLSFTLARSTMLAAGDPIDHRSSHPIPNSYTLKWRH